MSDYAKATCDLFYGATSAAADKIAARKLISEPPIPAEHLYQRLSAVTGGGTGIDQSQFLTIAELYLWNRDATNYVTITYTCASTSISQQHKVIAGQWIKLVDVKITGSMNIIANTTACICEIWIVGT